MKKLLIALIALLSLFALVSCKEEDEPTRPVKVTFDGNTYDCYYVGASYDISKEFVDIAFYPELGDVASFKNVFNFEIPVEMFGKTSVTGTDSFEGTERDFCFDCIKDGHRNSYDYEWLENGSELTFSCRKNADYEIRDFTISLEAVLYNGKDLSVSFSGKPDFALVDGQLFL